MATVISCNCDKKASAWLIMSLMTNLNTQLGGQEGQAVTDAELVRRAQADTRAFEPLYERYVVPVYRYCLLRLNSREAAEDATSEVFLKAIAALPRFRPGVFGAWLFRITRNVVIDAYRLHHASAQVAMPIDSPDFSPLPEDVIAAQARRQAVTAAVAQLGDEQRTVIELGLAGWSDRQIAEATEKSVAAIKMLRYRAVRRLQTELAQPGGVFKEDSHG